MDKYIKQLENEGRIEKVGFIYKTTDHSIFNHMKTNRIVDNARKEKIGKSIDENGYIEIPISCNEKLEIIDGQGREKCLSERNIPALFHVIPGAGSKECQILNINQTGWKHIDYVRSYANDEKFKNRNSYKNILFLTEAFKGLPFEIICMVASGTSSTNCTKQIKNGTFKCELNEDVVSQLEYLREIKPFVDKVSGNKKLIYVPILFAIRTKAMDKKRLTSKLKESCENIQVVDVKSAFDAIENTYNRCLRSEKVSLWFPYVNSAGKSGNGSRGRS